jgi:Mrp family chromosome partitioning ATPase
MSPPASPVTGAPANRLASSLLDLQFIILSGKGGVGRTTVAAALARAAWSRGKRVLVAQTDASERLGHMLGRAGAIGPTVRTLYPGLDAVNMTPRESLHQYALLVLKYEAVYRALFDNRAVRGFLSAVPGLDAYAMLGKAWWHTTESVGTTGAASARLKYDLVILDGPASGHAMAMLKIPGAILSTMPTGPLVKDARALMTLLADAKRAALVIVTRPEELPARETVELVQAAQTLPELHLGPLIVNAVPPAPSIAPAVSAILQRLASTSNDDPVLKDVVTMVAAARQRWQSAQRILEQLGRAPGLPMLELPALSSTSLGIAEIDRLARCLTGEA